jgi:hypothetical protein
VRLKADAAIGEPLLSKAAEARACQNGTGRRAQRHTLFRRVFESLSQKLIEPSDPTVEKVPCTGWKEMSLTQKSCCGSRLAAGGSLRWHLNEKLRLRHRV